MNVHTWKYWHLLCSDILSKKTVWISIKYSFRNLFFYKKNNKNAPKIRQLHKPWIYSSDKLYFKIWGYCIQTSIKNNKHTWPQRGLNDKPFTCMYLPKQLSHKVQWTRKIQSTWIHYLTTGVADLYSGTTQIWLLAEVFKH